MDHAPDRAASAAALETTNTAEFLVRLATAVTTLVATTIAVAGLKSGQTDVAWSAISPASIAVLGVFQLVRRRPNPALMVAVSVGTTVFLSPFLPAAMTTAVVMVLAVFGTVVMFTVRRQLSTTFAVASGTGLIMALHLANAASSVNTVTVLTLGLGGAGIAAWATGRRVLKKYDRLERAYESPAVSVAIVSIPDGRFLEVNQAACEMLGYPEEELLQLGIADVTDPEDQEESYERFKALIEGPDRYSQGALRYVRKDGEVSWALVTNTIMRDWRGRPLYALAQVVDISEQKAAEQRLEQLVESKDRLVASVSHELRTPLTGLLGFAEVLRDKGSGLSAAERVEMTESIAFEASEMAGIVEDLLTAARFDTGTLKVARVPVNLLGQSRQVVEAMEPHGLKVEVLGEPTQAMGDPARVRQIIRNLLTNAQRHGGNEITLTVSSSVADGARVAVTDSGPGVSPEDVDRIFEPYYTRDASPGAGGGFGLGLDICRKLAVLMEGDLIYTGEPGAARFELVLPAAVHASAHRPIEPQPIRRVIPDDGPDKRRPPRRRSA